MIEKELGLEPDWLFKVQSIAFIYVSPTKEVLGCVVVENIKQAFSATTSSTNTTTHEHSTPEGVIILDSKTKKKALWGIRVMWTSSLYRRKGIATKLLDSVRSQLARGCILPRSKIAFTQPTAAGTAFIRKYTGEENFLVYKS